MANSYRIKIEPVDGGLTTEVSHPVDGGVSAVVLTPSDVQFSGIMDYIQAIKDGTDTSSVETAIDGL